MDDIMRQAMAKWPNVPDCLSWLTLDRRGQWRMRNEYAQANKLSGEPIRHTALIDLIVCNYAHDDAGRWFFQNGPQRMLVELDYTPWMAQLSADDVPRAFTTTTGAAFSPSGCPLDKQGSVLLSGYVDGFEAEETIAMLHDHDLEPFSSLANRHAEACEAALGTLTWGDRTFDIESIACAEMAKRYSFVARPAG